MLGHDTLLSIIRDEFSEEIGLQEILESSYKNAQNKKRPMYELTTLQAKQLLARESKVVRKALLIYIERLETLLRERQTAEWRQSRHLGKKTRRSETDIIMTKLIPHAEAQGGKNVDKFYTAYSKLVNTTLGIQAGMRDSLPHNYLSAISFMENAIENIISNEVDKGTHCKEIFQVCKVKCGILKELSFLPKLPSVGNMVCLHTN